MRGCAAYRLSRRLELARRQLFRWNRLEVEDLVRKVEQVEAEIATFQIREDNEGYLPSSDLTALRANIATHYSLLQQQEIY